ncbi:MAG: HAMP domain-containing methyl-accepting chemotaxis protein [Desulfobulbaceae bacterium]|nr:HAMP domain-containing methyl-accepting chemotaxis protein [Desulfobulbaceae bacterium]
MTKSLLTFRSITLNLVVSVVLTLLASMLVGMVLLNDYVRREMTNANMTAVDNLAQSLQQGVKDSLERGQMKNFQKLLLHQKDIRGVLDVSLYDRQLRGNLSSSGESIKGQPLADDLQKELKDAKEPLIKIDPMAIKIYTPQIVTADCIRCHPTWRENEQGGIIVLTFDLTPLNQTLGKQKLMLSVGCLGLLLIVSFIIFLLARSLTSPVVQMTMAMARLAAGDLSVKVPAQEREDEIGKMAAAVQVFKNNALDRLRLEEEQEASKLKAAQEKTALMNKLATDFEENIGGLIGGVSAAVTQLESSAKKMADTASQTKTKSDSVAMAAANTSTNVMTVASATEELSSSVGEISRQVAQSADVARNAVQKASHSNQMVSSLANASQKIGEVVKLITDIAGQTKLLALNATIEAARAGEVGKGFAVVANEVKELAKQTTAATKEISDQIAGIQGATNEAVESIRDIGTTIGEINEISTNIAAAVEEQGVVTLDIAQNTQQAAAGSKAVSGDISIVAAAADETGVTATHVLEAASDLSQKANALRHDVTLFLDTIRRS